MAFKRTHCGLASGTHNPGDGALPRAQQGLCKACRAGCPSASCSPLATYPLAQVFPLKPRPALQPLPPLAEATDRFTDRPPLAPLMTLHLDFCQLRGSRSLGAAVARLRLKRWGAAAVQFEAAVGGDVDVTSYGGGISAAAYQGGDGGWSDGGSGGDEGELLVLEDGAEGGAGDGAASDDDGPSSSGDGDAEGADPGSMPAASGARPAADPPTGGCALLEQLASGDEVMVDLALYDNAGRLLVGRCARGPGLGGGGWGGAGLAPIAGPGAHLCFLIR